MADHKNFTVATNVQVYFCDPRSPWQRGSNENTNGLLRQYFPRGTDLSRFSQDYLNRIARRLNQRPRKTLGFETPADRRKRDNDTDANVGRPLRLGERAKNRQAQKSNPADVSKFHAFFSRATHPLYAFYVLTKRQRMSAFGT